MELFLDIGKCSFKTQVLVSKMPSELNIEYTKNWYCFLVPLPGDYELSCPVPPDAIGNGSSDALVSPRTVETSLYNVRDSIKLKI